MFCFGQDRCSLICSSACCPVRKSILKTLESSADSFRSLKACGRQGRLLRYPARDRLGRLLRYPARDRLGRLLRYPARDRLGTFESTSGERELEARCGRQQVAGWWWCRVAECVGKVCGENASLQPLIFLPPGSPFQPRLSAVPGGRTRCSRRW